MSVKSDVKSIVSKSVSVPLSAAATCISIAADSLGYAESAVKHTPAVVGALLRIPFAAAKGYIMETEGVSSDVAEERAYRYLKQDLSRTIAEAGEGAGSVLAALLKDDLDNVTTDSSKDEGEQK